MAGEQGDAGPGQVELEDEIERRELGPEAAGELEPAVEEEPAEQPGDEIDVPFPVVQPGIDFNQLDNALQHVQV
jgi:hypothetical protein